MKDTPYHRLLKLCLLRTYIVGQSEKFEDLPVERKREIYATVDILFEAIAHADWFLQENARFGEEPLKEATDRLAKELLHNPGINPVFK